MSARYTLRRARLADVAAALNAEVSASAEALYKPRYNAAPGDIGWVVSCGAKRRILHPARWEYLIGANRPLTNIRSESMVFSRFRDVFASNRCVIVADGFFEWPREDLNAVWFHLPDDGLVLFGGLLQRPKAGGVYPRFSLLTARPDGALAKFSDRMPVVIKLSRLDDWLTAAPEVALTMLAPAPARALVATRVSSYVNNVKHDDPLCIAPPSYDA